MTVEGAEPSHTFYHLLMVSRSGTLLGDVRVWGAPRDESAFCQEVVASVRRDRPPTAVNMTTAPWVRQPHYWPTWFDCRWALVREPGGLDGAWCILLWFVASLRTWWGSTTWHQARPNDYTGVQRRDRWTGTILEEW